jgi:two-component system OmpR family response regulator
MSHEAHETRFDGREISLTALEFGILGTLLGHPNMVFTREKIMDAIRGGTIHVSDRTIDSHIRNIRAKLTAAGCENGIETVHGVGFRIGRCEAAS